MDNNNINKLINLGFNIMPVSSGKTPLFLWKDYQDKKVLNIEQFNVKSSYHALICGFNDLEVVDVDLKVLALKEDRDVFFNSLLTMLSDHIDNFLDRIVIKKTKNFGYHIIYRSKKLSGNIKLAHTLAGDCIIETRGIGGYACIYDDSYNLDYDNITLITDEERDIIIDICKTFNEKQDVPIQIDIKNEKKYKVSEKTLTPWDDFNNKNNIFDIIGDEFTVIKNTSSKIIVRRIGAKSPHSGYIFKNSGCLYLFSTNTRYPNEKLITPFMAYAIKNFGDDYSRAASHLYSNGYGDRGKPQLNAKIKIEKIEIPKGLFFPIDIFPHEIQQYIFACNKTLSNSIDYMGCSLLWIASLIIGNSFNIEVKKGWTEIPTLWIAIVGGAGIGKSPSINSMIFPLEKINGNERRRYVKLKREYDEYMALSKKEKDNAIEIEEPRRTQFIVDDVTIEALINLHSQNLAGVGVFKDELAGWFKDMNKYKEGSDKEQWLSSWSGRGISVDRISRQSDYIAHPILPVLGGIQPLILAGFLTDENKDNGFIDRMLFSFPDLCVERYIIDEIDPELISFYDNWIVNFYQEAKKLISINEFGDITPTTCVFDFYAKIEWERIFNKITALQNSDDTPEFLKSMLAKQKSYIPRFALILNTISAFHEGGNITLITADNIIKAERLSDYFFEMNQKMILSNMENAETKKIIYESKGDIINQLKSIVAMQGTEFNKTAVAKELNISRKTLHKYLKIILKCEVFRTDYKT